VVRHRDNAIQNGYDIPLIFGRLSGLGARQGKAGAAGWLDILLNRGSIRWAKVRSASGTRLGTGQWEGGEQ
jgi:hypothetical protein